jgi:hypothetical protein
MNSIAFCLDCGRGFSRPAGETWRVRCVPCWRKVKGIEPYVVLPPAQAELGEHLRALLQLCHPDKHGGSALSNEVTAWLLRVREELAEEEPA